MSYGLDPVQDAVGRWSADLGHFVAFAAVTAVISLVAGGVAVLIARIASEAYWRSKLEPKLLPSDDADAAHTGNRKAWTSAALWPVVITSGWFVGLTMYENNALAALFEAPIVYLISLILFSRFSSVLSLGDHRVRAAASLARRKMEVATASR